MVPVDDVSATEVWIWGFSHHCALTLPNKHNQMSKQRGFRPHPQSRLATPSPIALAHVACLERRSPCSLALVRNPCSTSNQPATLETSLAAATEWQPRHPPQRCRTLLSQTRRAADRLTNIATATESPRR